MHTRDKKLLVLILIIIVTLILIIHGLLDPDAPQIQPPATIVKKEQPGTNAWKDITPGVTNYNEAKTSLGKLLKQKYYKGNIIYIHRDFETGIREQEIGVDEYGTVRYIRIPIPYDKAAPRSSYEERLGLENPDIVKYDRGGFWEKSYVFLKKGVLLGVQENLDLVYHEMYFEPMSYDDFMYFWGDNLIDNYVHPQDVFQNDGS